MDFSCSIATSSHCSEQHSHRCKDFTAGLSREETMQQCRGGWVADSLDQPAMPDVRTGHVRKGGDCGGSVGNKIRDRPAEG